MTYKTFYYSQTKDGTVDMYLTYMLTQGWYFESFYPEFNWNQYTGHAGRILFTKDE
jgi:hypothetical protein